MAGWLPVKVALLSDCYLPRLGGIEVQVDGLARRLVTAGHEVDVYTATAGPGGEHGGAVVEHGGVRVHHFSTPLTFGVPVNPLSTKPIRDLLAAGGYDVAHAHMGVVSPFATATIGAAVGVGIPTAVTWHCMLDRSRPLFRALGHARRWREAGAALSAVSRVAAGRVEGVAGGPVAVLHNGIDVAAWRTQDGREPLPRSVTLPDRDEDSRPGREAGEGPVTLVSAMRLVRRKRPDAALEVVARAGETVGSGAVRLDVFGDGPSRRHLEREMEQRGLAGAVTLRGRVTRDELRAAYAHADAYLSTTRLEAFGIAALEARAAGLPVLALRGSGIEDFVTDGVDGLLADDDAGLAAAVARLVEQPDLLGRIREHNRTVPPAQDWEQVLGATLAEYDRARVG
jgi:glycosyltransferase involved in cell wall biosynthesis